MRRLRRARGTGTVVAFVVVASWGILSELAVASELGPEFPECRDARRCYELGTTLLEDERYADAATALERVLGQLSQKSPPARVIMLRLRLSDAYGGWASTSQRVEHVELAVLHRVEALRLIRSTDAPNEVQVQAETAALIARQLVLLAAGAEPEFERAWGLTRKLEVVVGPLAELASSNQGADAIEAIASAVAAVGEAEAGRELNDLRRKRVTESLRDCLAWVPDGDARVRIERLLYELDPADRVDAQPAPTPLAQAPREPVEADTNRWSRMEFAGLGSLVAGGLSLGLGVGLVVPEDPLVEGSCCVRYRGRRYAGYTVLAGGAALIVTGATLLGVGRDRRRRHPVAVAPALSPQTVGLALSGRF